MTRSAAEAADPDSGTDPGLDPESPYTSLRARIAIFVVAGGLSLLLALSSDHTVFGGLDGYPWGLRAADVACGVVAYVALWWRRRWPLAFAAYIVVISVFSTLSGGLAFVAAFTVAVHRNWPTALVTSALLTLAAWPSLVLYTGGGTRNVGVLMVVVTVLLFAATGWGMFIRARRQLVASLRGRAERAERSREEHARLARIAERQRIAREMHDVLAHRLSLLSVQAGALEVTPSAAGDEDATTEAAAAIRATTHQALRELRSIVRVLRDDDIGGEAGTAPPQPVAADLPALVAEASATTSIRADWSGVELAAVPPDTGRTLYRIVQEGLTNARKHAPGSAVVVAMDGAPQRGLSVTVTSWLPVDRPAPGDGASTGRAGTAGTGTGLIGLHERAALAGGHVDAAVTGDDRFELSAWLPWADR
ncbi:MAG TPA: histidine kinase [Streptosporangiaceae bacterium]